MPLLSSDGDLTLYAGIGVFAGLGLFYKGIKDWFKFKKVADTPTSKVRSMAAGLIELNGKVVEIEPGQLLTAPITGDKCVYYRVVHQMYVRSKNGGTWVTTGTDTDMRNFYLQDDTGKVEVNPKSAEVDLPSNYTRTFGSRRDIEYRLATGATGYILGSANIRPGVKSKVNEDNFIIGRGENDKTYYITNKSESDVQKSLSRGSLLSIAGGIIITIASLGYLLFRFAFA